MLIVFAETPGANYALSQFFHQDDDRDDDHHDLCDNHNHCDDHEMMRMIRKMMLKLLPPRMKNDKLIKS